MRGGEGSNIDILYCHKFRSSVGYWIASITCEGWILLLLSRGLRRRNPQEEGGWQSTSYPLAAGGRDEMERTCFSLPHGGKKNADSTADTSERAALVINTHS